MDVIKLQSGSATAEILPQRGALISRLYLPNYGDVLWMPNDFQTKKNDWPGGGLPFLFPFAGRVQHDGQVYQYGLGTEIFPMPLHGFSWSADWKLLEINPSSAKLLLKATSETKRIYPFEFSVVMRILLSDNKINLTVEITNHGPAPQFTNQKMPVAIGWHPYFTLANQATRLTLAAKSVHRVTQQGMAGDKLNASDYLGAGPWNLPKQELNSLILGDLLEERAELIRQDRRIVLECFPKDLFNYFVTWSNAPSDFLCIEPWMSQPNAVATPTGCRWLASSESLSAQLTITAP